MSTLAEERSMKTKFIRNLIILAVLAGFLGGCASSQFMAQPGDGVTIMPDGKMASIAQNGLAITATKTGTPYGLNDRIVAFQVTLINQTDAPIEFIPKQYLLFDQNNRQYLALTKPDLSEAAGNGAPRDSAFWGFGMGTFHSHSMIGMHYYSSPYWFNDPWFPRQSYQGLLAKALPIHPVTVFPHAMMDGNIYFSVPPSALTAARLQIVRLSRIPEKDSPAEEIPYCFDYSVIR